MLYVIIDEDGEPCYQTEDEGLVAELGCADAGFYSYPVDRLPELKRSHFLEEASGDE